MSMLPAASDTAFGLQWPAGVKTVNAHAMGKQRPAGTAIAV